MISIKKFLIPYSALMTIPIFILLIIFNINIGNSIVFHIQGFNFDVITDITYFDVDFIGMLIIGWVFSIIYSSFLVSQC